MQASYQLPIYSSGSTQIQLRPVNKTWCAPDQRKRPVDAVLLSIGGNDVGFSALMLYAMTESAGDLAPIANVIGKQIRFSPQVSRAYLERLPERMKALRDALRDGFGVPPNRVLQTAYEPIQFDENGAVCGAQPTLGLDVNPKLRLSPERLQETVSFLNDFFARIVCIDNGRAPNCPVIATGAGTGFQLITDHQPAFAKRGICSRDPRNAQADGALMAIPRLVGGEDFVPYSPAAFLPYQHRWRLFRTPNDAFMTANVHSNGISLLDIMQPVYAAMYSGAVHPTAEAHAIVADHVVRHVRKLVGAPVTKEAELR
jgi:lysophospholipase L1-like esterase